MFSLLIPYLAPFFGIFHPRHQITGGNITYIHSTHTPHVGRDYLQISPSYQFGHFYSHASCEARLCRGLSPAFVYVISTHTPLARRDEAVKTLRQTSPISTHTPLARRDNFPEKYRDYVKNFYSHASCEARRRRKTGGKYEIEFLLTRLLRGATFAAEVSSNNSVISTHTPHAGRDTEWLRRSFHIGDFYSHAPCGARQK